MKKSISVASALLCFAFLLNAKEQIPVVPAPQKISSQEGYFILSENIPIAVTGNMSEANRFAGEQIQQSMKEFLGISSNIILNTPDKKGIQLNQIDKYEDRINAQIPADKLEESYRLVVSENGIEIQSLTAKGIFYGSMSLIQLLEKTENKKLPGVEIIDWPDMKIRGISDDISRGQVSNPENFKRIIQFISRYKMNTYMPYMEDMIRFDAYPTIGVNRGALTKDEIRELVAFAKKYYVDVIPIFQTLGHYENILSQPEFLKYAEFPRASCLDVSNDSTYVFLETMLKEVFDLFPSPYIHIGADESWDVGLGKSKALVEKYGIAKVHANHYKKVYDICKKNGKKVMMYGDIILNNKDILKDIPKDITIVDWLYIDYYHFPSTEIFKKAGFNYCVSPTVWNWQTDFPIYQIAMPNIKNFTKSGIENGAMGMINSNWGDYGAETFKELNLFGYAWSAQCAWNLSASDAGTFSENYFYDFFGINDPRAQNIYQTFTNSFDHLNWHDFWHHPALPLKQSKWWLYQMSPVGKLNWMDWTLPQTLKDINELQGKVKVKKNKDHFDLLRFLVEMDEFYELKTQTMLIMQDKMNKVVIDDAGLVKMIDDNVAALEDLKAKYKMLWLKYYKPENLGRIEDKFNRLIAYFNETKEEIKNNNLVSPLIESQWINCKNADSTFSKTAQFKKQFMLMDIPTSGQLQLIGNGQAKLYINGKYVDQVFERRHLSLVTEYQRVKFIDVTKYLQKGQNEISLEVKNYENKGVAAVNIIAEIQTGKTTTRLKTDDSWQAMNTDMSNKIAWQKANNMANYPNAIISPNFKTKRASWIER